MKIEREKKLMGDVLISSSSSPPSPPAASFSNKTDIISIGEGDQSDSN